MSTPEPSYRGSRFHAEIIGQALWLYFRFSLTFRDVEDLFAERGTAGKKCMAPESLTIDPDAACRRKEFRYLLTEIDLQLRVTSKYAPIHFKRSSSHDSEIHDPVRVASRTPALC